MKHIYDIVSNFNTLKEYTEFMEQLVEKKAAGDEISRGMNKHDKSKTEKKAEKKQVISKEVKKHANGSSTEKHYDHIDPNVEQQPEQPPVPLQPGQQVNIGNKKINQQALKPKTIPVELSGEKDKLNMRPTVKVNPTQMK